ncbi:hypothetical protein KGY64_04170 [Candidatus Bipolaricaulota bacterium]|nr:hypothetical protein [Candidatus Bipolaricaulota bacterium]
MSNISTSLQKGSRDGLFQTFFHRQAPISVRTFFLITVVLLALVFAEANPSAGDYPFSGDLDTSVSLRPGASGPIEDFDSELTLAYETDFFKAESETEFGIDGFDGMEVSLEFDLDSYQLKGEIEFGDDPAQLEEFKGKGSMELDEVTEVKLDLDADYEVDGNYRGRFELEWDLEVERELPYGVEVELELNFSPEGESYPLPEEIEVDLKDVVLGEVELDTTIEWEEGEWEETELDFEFLEPLYTSPHLALEGSLVWAPDEKYMEITPELECSLATLSADGVLAIDGGSHVSGLELATVKIDDLALFDSTIDLSIDLVDEGHKLVFNREIGKSELTLEVESDPTSSELPFGLSKFGGEVNWEPVDQLELELSLESTTEYFPEEITLSSTYSF